MDISNNPNLPKDSQIIENKDKLDLDDMKEHLKDHNTIITHSSSWNQMNKEDIMRTFNITQEPQRYTLEEVKERMLEIYNENGINDPLSVESLKQKFPSFPESWYTYMSESSKEKIKLIKEEEEVLKKKGEFNITFN